MQNTIHEFCPPPPPPIPPPPPTIDAGYATDKKIFYIVQPGCRSEAKTNYGVVSSKMLTMWCTVSQSNEKLSTSKLVKILNYTKYRAENCQILQPDLRRALNAVRRRKQIMVRSTYSNKMLSKWYTVWKIVCTPDKFYLSCIGFQDAKLCQLSTTKELQYLWSCSAHVIRILCCHSYKHFGFFHFRHIISLLRQVHFEDERSSSNKGH